MNQPVEVVEVMVERKMVEVVESLGHRGGVRGLWFCGSRGFVCDFLVIANIFCSFPEVSLWFFGS